MQQPTVRPERSGSPPPNSSGGDLQYRLHMGATTRDRIVSVALRLFAEKGFAAVGIREIATEVGISSASLYHYMGSKDDLLQEIMTDRLSRLIAVATEALSGLSRPEDKLVTLVRTHVLVHALHPDSVVDYQVTSLNPAARAAVIALRDEYEGTWRSLLDEGLRPPAVFSMASPKLTRLALLEMCNGVASWYAQAGEFSLEHIADYYASLALSMVAAESGGLAIRRETTAGPAASSLLALIESAYPPVMLAGPNAAAARLAGLRADARNRRRRAP
jgi:AcrR family transcriptional regulator